MRRLRFAACLLAACNDAPKDVAAPAAPVVQPAALATDAWIGDWVGVEGNTLRIEAGPAPGAYRISERTLDGPLSYDGRAAGDPIVFQETDKVRTIRAGAGAQTGLKYLAEKTNCLWIEPGRGFCRD